MSKDSDNVILDKERIVHRAANQCRICESKFQDKFKVDVLQS